MLCWEKSSTFGVKSIDIDPIPCYGTTHADYFYGEIPCVRCLTKEEINSAYEENTGHLIVLEFKRMKKDVMAVPAVLCKNHGPFSWARMQRRPSTMRWFLKRLPRWHIEPS